MRINDPNFDADDQHGIVKYMVLRGIRVYKP